MDLHTSQVTIKQAKIFSSFPCRMCSSSWVTWSELGHRPNQCCLTTTKNFQNISLVWVQVISTRADQGYMWFQRDVLVKLGTCALCLLVYLTFYRVCPVERVIADPYITSQPFYLRILYLYLSMLSLRPKYYFVWTLGE